MKKRQFLKRLGQATLVSPFLAVPLQGHSQIRELPYPKNDDAAFWERIRMDYTRKPDYINLENGYYNFVPTPILNKYMEHVRRVNYEASYYMVPCSGRIKMPLPLVWRNW